MKLEQQVTSLEISKKLKELGVKQESLFYWVRIDTDIGSENWDIYKGQREEVFGIEVKKNLSAFTVAELGEMLPKIQWLTTNIKEGGYRIDIFQTMMGLQSDTEADARGKMLIYLLENNLIS